MLVGFSGLPNGLELLEGNVHDQHAPPNNELVVLRPWGCQLFEFLDWIIGHHRAH